MRKQMQAVPGPVEKVIGMQRFFFFFAYIASIQMLQAKHHTDLRKCHPLRAT